MLFALIGRFSNEYCGGYGPAILAVLAYIVCELDRRK